MSRRALLSTAATATAAAAAFAKAKAPNAAKLDALLKEGIERLKIPAVAAAVATANETLYTGAFGIRDSASRTPVTPQSIFAIASMTKAITTTAALQLVERGKLTLDDPIGKHLPEFRKLQVLEGFDPSTGAPRLRPAAKQPTLRQLLTHTGGFAYDNWNADLFRYFSKLPERPAVPPLLSEPGTRWEYGTNLDWTGRIVETASGMSLEQYFQQNILQPLGLKDTSYILTPEKFPRKVAVWRRQPDGVLKEDPYALPPPPTSFNGGGGLYSTAPDYIQFMQMILHDGAPGILKPATVAQMRANQTGTLAAGKMKTARPENSSDVDFHPANTDHFTFGFLLNSKAYGKGRSAGSLAWAGIMNTFYWIDPKRSLCATLMMQYYPFCDRDAISLLKQFESAVYYGH